MLLSRFQLRTTARMASMNFAPSSASRLALSISSGRRSLIRIWRMADGGDVDAGHGRVDSEGEDRPDGDQEE